MGTARLINIGVAAVWLINGLVCKILDLVPRHREIVARILGEEHAFALTRVIGVAEVLMAVWVASGVFSRLNAASQIFIILTMNAIEQILAARSAPIWQA